MFKHPVQRSASAFLQSQPPQSVSSNDARAISNHHHQTDNNSHCVMHFRRTFAVILYFQSTHRATPVLLSLHPNARSLCACSLALACGVCVRLRRRRRIRPNSYEFTLVQVSRCQGVDVFSACAASCSSKSSSSSSLSLPMPNGKTVRFLCLLAQQQIMQQFLQTVQIFIVSCSASVCVYVCACVGFAYHHRRKSARRSNFTHQAVTTATPNAQVRVCVCVRPLHAHFFLGT